MAKKQKEKTGKKSAKGTEKKLGKQIVQKKAQIQRVELKIAREKMLSQQLDKIEDILQKLNKK